MGYGKQSLKILQNYFEGKIPNLDETTTSSTMNTVQPEVSFLNIVYIYTSMMSSRSL